MKTKAQLSKQIFSILLCLALMLTFASMTVSAEGQNARAGRVANAIYYNANGGVGGPSNNFTGGTTATVQTGEPTREGYIFDVWNTEADGTGDDYIGGSTYTFTEDDGSGGCKVTLYAQWIKVYGICIGGVEITDTNKDDVFGDDKVFYDAEANVLTLNGWSYEGEGCRYDPFGAASGGTGELYSAVIYSEGSLTIRLKGNSMLKNSFDDPDEGQYGDGIIAEGSVTFIGDGNISIFGSYAVDADQDVTVDGSTLHMETTDDAIGAVSGDVIIKNNAKVSITAMGDGIYAGNDVTITDSNVTITADGDGIYSHNGSVNIVCTNAGLFASGPWLDGTKVSIASGGDCGISAGEGITVDEKLTISTPEGGKVCEMQDEGYFTVAVGDAVAKNIVIEPMSYTVTISGLQTDMEVPVPAGQSLNEAYCGIYGITDFSEILYTEKEGYTFGGWYTDKACTDGNEFEFDNAVSADTTIYPKWVVVTTGGNTENDDNKPTDIPPTGDNGNIMLWFALLLLSGGAVITLTVVDRKRRKNTI